MVLDGRSGSSLHKISANSLVLNSASSTTGADRASSRPVLSAKAWSSMPARTQLAENSSQLSSSARGVAPGRAAMPRFTPASTAQLVQKTSSALRPTPTKKVAGVRLTPQEDRLHVEAGSNGTCAGRIQENGHRSIEVPAEILPNQEDGAEEMALEASRTPVLGPQRVPSVAEFRPVQLFQFASPDRDASQRIASPLRVEVVLTDVDQLEAQKEQCLQPPPTQIIPLTARRAASPIASMPPMPTAEIQQEEIEVPRTLERQLSRDSCTQTDDGAAETVIQRQLSGSSHDPVILLPQRRISVQHRVFSSEHTNVGSPAFVGHGLRNRTPPRIQEAISPRRFTADSFTTISPSSRETTACTRFASKEKVREACSTPTSSSREICRLQEENEYLRKNNNHLRGAKHRMETRIGDLENRNRFLEQEMEKHKVLFQQSQRDYRSVPSGCEVEIQNLRDQLEAVMQIKQALNTENLELQRRLEAKHYKDAKEAACVVCMDNLANLVCMPCKHLAICMDCGKQEAFEQCPICRKPVVDMMQIFCP